MDSAPSRWGSKKRLSFSEWYPRFVTLLKENWLNWASFLLLSAAFVAVEYGTTPFVRRVPPDEWENLKYPYDPDNTVPSFVVPIYGVVVPLLLAILYHALRGCEIREFHDLVYGMLVNVSITALATVALKNSIGRLRPNFFERCYQDTFSVTEPLQFEAFSPPDCTNPDKDEVEGGRKSFPSGHSSWAMCQGFFVTLFLIGKMRVFDGRGHIWKLIVSLVPTWIAVGIGITRINDYMHHWTDVVAGLLLGMVVGLSIYLMYYPWPFARTGTDVPLYMFLPSSNESPPNLQTALSADERTERDMEQGMVRLNIKSAHQPSEVPPDRES